MALPRTRSSLYTRTISQWSCTAPKIPLRVSLTSNNPPSHIPSPILIFHRTATHQATRAVNGPKGGPGKALGAKKSGGKSWPIPIGGWSCRSAHSLYLYICIYIYHNNKTPTLTTHHRTEQYVIPGNIIFRQRGSKWFAGTNAGMGRDHTIYAMEAGYVKYYRDPFLHPKRKYIGVAWARDDRLPYPRNAPRQRRLGMVAVPIQQQQQQANMEEEEKSSIVGGFPEVVRLEKNDKEEKVLRLRRPGYMYREGNWEIGRAAEKAGVRVREYQPGNRWLAWRKRAARRRRRLERGRMFRRAKAGKKVKSAGRRR